jgi:hypothetical protein
MAFSTHQFISIAVGHVWTLSLSDSYQTSQLCSLTGSHHVSSSKVSRARFIPLLSFRSFDIAIHEVKLHKYTIYDRRTMITHFAIWIGACLLLWIDVIIFFILTGACWPVILYS